MLFSVNQASHLYVANNYKDVLAEQKRAEAAEETPNHTAGDIYAYVKDDNLFFSYFGKGGLLRSDLIPVKNIMHYSIKSADDLRIPLKKATVVLNNKISATPVAGQDYILRVKYSIGSIDNQYIKYGAVHGFVGMTADDFYTEMVKSLNNNFKREAEPAFTFKKTDSGIEITEVEPKWVLGTYPQRPIDFEISVDTIVVKDVGEGPWGEVTISLPEEMNDETSYSNSKKIADFEWFCMGERGDQYKNYGWPNIIPTKYMVDPTDKDGYDVINIHYSYVGSNESVQKSEKDIFIVVPNAAHDTVTTPIENAIKAAVGE
jgi:hypothetical protein